MLTQSVQAYLLAYDAEDDMTLGFEISEKAMNECLTTEDWQACLDTFGERVVGNYVADNADDEAFHLAESSGIAAVYFGDNEAIVSEWNDQGFYDVTLTTADRAIGAIDEANEDWHEAEPEEETED